MIESNAELDAIWKNRTHEFCAAISVGIQEARYQLDKMLKEIRTRLESDMSENVYLVVSKCDEDRTGRVESKSAFYTLEEAQEYVRKQIGYSKEGNDHMTGDVDYYILKLPIVHHERFVKV